MNMILNPFISFPSGGGPADTGWLSTGNVSDNSDEGNSWSNLSNVENATIDNTSVASCMNIGRGDYTNSLNCTQFNASVPSGATITGVEFRQKSKANNSNDMVRNRTYILQASVKSGTGDGVFGGGMTSTLTTYESGSSSSMHGTTLIAGDGSASNDVNHTGFGMWLRWEDDGSGGNDDTYLAVAQLKIHYTT